MVPTTLKPQNLVQNRNSKTHLTNHCLGIRCGKILSKVVEPQGRKYKSTFTYSILQINKTVFNHGYKQVERKEKYIVDDQLDGSITIYQVKSMTLKDLLPYMDYHNVRIYADTKKGRIFIGDIYLNSYKTFVNENILQSEVVSILNGEITIDVK